jgi:hypothetical protein
LKCENPGDTEFQLLSLNGVALNEKDVIYQDQIYTIERILHDDLVYAVDDSGINHAINRIKLSNRFFTMNSRLLDAIVEVSFFVQDPSGIIH